MFYIYIIQSSLMPTKIYKGFTTDLLSRLSQHNRGHSRHTAKYRPWKLIFYCAFSNKAQALKFESYLKTSSGIAFARKRLIQDMPILPSPE